MRNNRHIKTGGSDDIIQIQFRRVNFPRCIRYAYQIGHGQVALFDEYGYSDSLPAAAIRPKDRHGVSAICVRSVRARASAMYSGFNSRPTNRRPCLTATLPTVPVPERGRETVSAS